MKKNKKKIDFGFSFAESIQGLQSRLRLPTESQVKVSQDWSDEDIVMETSSSISPWRLVPIYIAFAFIFIILGARAFKLQVIEGSNFQNRSEGNHVQVKISHAPRGVIYDRNGKVLVRNEPGYRVAVRKVDLPKDWNNQIDELSKILGKNKNEVEKLINESKTDSVTIAQDLTNEQIITLKTNEDKFPWLDIELNPKRNYVYGPALASVLGYTREVSVEDLQRTDTVPYSSGDQIGKAGIEASFEKELRGANGYSLIKVDSQGKKQGILFETKPVAGGDVTLSIDAELQKYVYEQLTEMLKNKGGTGASAVIQDPNSGEVLALVSIPTYDNNIFSRQISASEYSNLINDKGFPLLNRPIEAVYPPGSTFKMIVSVAGLETGTVTKSTKIKDTGFFQLGDIVFNNWLWTDHKRTDGDVDVVRALARSNDTYYYNLGYRLGVENIARYTKEFGIGEKTGIELPGEVDGLVPTPEWKEKTFNQVWFPGDTINYSIGQGYLLVSPIQLNQMTTLFANGGQLLKPTLLHNNGIKVVKSDFLRAETIATIREGMYQNTVGDGNVSYLFSNFRLKSAGKTGSAESGGENKAHAWYTAYAPLENPRISVTVMFEKAGHGSEVAAPVVKNIFKWYFKI